MGSELETRKLAESPFGRYYAKFSHEMYPEMKLLFDQVLNGDANHIRAVSLKYKRLSELDCRGLYLLLNELR